MADAAAGSVDKSVQVKLVLLGTPFLHIGQIHHSHGSNRFIFHSPPIQLGEAAVGKSSVVLRFVSPYLNVP